MTILTQLSDFISQTSSFSFIGKKFSEYQYPLYTSGKAIDFAGFIESVASFSYDIARFIIKSTFENADKTFRNMKDRSKRYHVKVTRSRTLITPFGEVTYSRTIYSYADGTPGNFCYVDRRFGIPKYDHFDPCVKGMIISQYADNNSMIKVGKIIGERIYSPFSLNPDKKYHSISRQTVKNILTTSKRIYLPMPRRKDTPETLYIMADEKWIPLQSHDAEGKAKKEMVKAAVVFEDVGTYKTSQRNVKKRHYLINKYIHFDSESILWRSLYERLNELYDLDKVKDIWILGDGAVWIKKGVEELKSQNYNVRFALDKFHFNQALTRITQNENIRDKLREYILEDENKKNFKDLINTLIEETPEREEKIREQEKYILNNWRYIHNSYKVMHKGCSMESAISHYICSSFTSVPKAYMEHNLPFYLDNRMYYLNGVDVTELYIKSLDYDRYDMEIINIKEPLNFSIFEPRNEYINSAISKWNKHVKYELYTINEATRGTMKNNTIINKG